MTTRAKHLHILCIDSNAKMVILVPFHSQIVHVRGHGGLIGNEYFNAWSFSGSSLYGTLFFHLAR
jgi:hypothetical protein